MRWRSPLVAAGAAVALLALAGPRLRPWWRERAVRAAPASPDVVLLTLDTTRADRLGCYGGDAATSPVLDGLARAGVVFRRAYTSVPITLPAHASLMTGVIPPGHGVHDNGNFVLDKGLTTMAEAFSRAGYRTGGFVSALVLDRRFGLARGFSHFEDELETDETEVVLAQVRAEVTVNRALAWLKEDDARPVFAWVHLYDPHDPYQPPEPFASRFKGKPYDGEIAYMDSEIGRLLQGMAERKRPTLVAAVADHGESLGEHGEPTHSFFIYGATQQVPLLLSFPGVLPAGAEVRPLVRALDLMPTILEIAKLPVPDGIDGRSLLPLVTGKSDRDLGPAYQEAYTPRLWWGAREVLGVRTGRWFFVRGPKPELYDVEEDPAETVNLAAERPEELERLGAMLDTLIPDGDPLARRAALDPDTARRLRALGYLGGGMGEDSAAAAGPLPDAKEIATLLRPIAEAESHLNKRDYPRALDAFRDLSSKMPHSTLLRARVAKTLFALGRYDDAYTAYRELRQKQPSEEGHRTGMARACFRAGKKAEALRIVGEAIRDFPDSVALHENAGIILEDAGRMAEAEAEYRRAVELGPSDLRPRLALASINDKQGDLEGAAEDFQAVVKTSPHSRQGRQAGRRLATLAEGFARDGKLAQARAAYAAAIESGQAEAAAYSNMGLVCYRMGLNREALTVLRQGAARFPDSADLRYRIARLLDDEGERGQAEAEYRKALELASGRNDARLRLARLLESTGRSGEAALLYRQVVDGDPGSREATGAREALRRLGPGVAGR